MARKLKINPALGALKKALRIDPTNAQTHYTIACYSALGGRYPTQAIRHLKKAIRIDPKFKTRARTEEICFDEIRGMHDFKNAIS